MHHRTFCAAHHIFIARVPLHSYLGYDYSESELFIFMDYCPGGDLQITIRTFGGLGFELASRYTRQICLGLEYLHDLGILHRKLGERLCVRYIWVVLFIVPCLLLAKSITQFR